MIRRLVLGFLAANGASWNYLPTRRLRVVLKQHFLNGNIAFVLYQIVWYFKRSLKLGKKFTKERLRLCAEAAWELRSRTRFKQVKSNSDEKKSSQPLGIEEPIGSEEEDYILPARDYSPDHYNNSESSGEDENVTAFWSKYTH